MATPLNGLSDLPPPGSDYLRENGRILVCVRRAVRRRHGFVFESDDGAKPHQVSAVGRNRDLFEHI